LDRRKKGKDERRERKEVRKCRPWSGSSGTCLASVTQSSNPSSSGRKKKKWRSWEGPAFQQSNEIKKREGGGTPPHQYCILDFTGSISCFIKQYMSFSFKIL
jgi:hypothetical protein